MKLKFTILLFLLLSYEAQAIHPITMSVGELVYKDKKMYLKFKFFTDDFEATLSQYCKSKTDLINGKINPSMEKCFQRYIASNFEFHINGSLIKWTYKGYYLKESVVYIEFETKFDNINSVKHLKVKNTLLFDVIAEQKNILNVNLLGLDKLKVLKFDNEALEYTEEVNLLEDK